MFSWLNFIVLFFFLQLTFFISFLIFLFLFGKKEIIWKGFYLFIGTVISFVLWFYYTPTISFFLIKDIQDDLILKDPNELVNFFLVFSTFFSIYFFIPFILFILYTYFVSTWTNYNKKNILNYFFVCVYINIITLYIVDQDLFLSSIQSLSTSSKVFFDFQPELNLFLSLYVGEFFDFCIFTYLVFFIFIFSLKNQNFLFWKGNFKLFFYFVCLIFLFYNFSGEGFLSDIILLFSSFFYFEIMNILIFFLSYLKRKKVKI